MPKFNILAVGDIHCGSDVGLLPPNFVASGGRELMLNAGQRYLWECWQHMAGELESLDIHAMVCMGDCVDGHQSKSRGGELCLPLISDQVKAATSCLQFIHKAIGEPTVYVIKGTPYHAGDCGDYEQQLASALGAGAARPFLDLDVDGVVINFLHGIGGSGGTYRATALDREALWSALAGKEGKALRADCLVRAHNHFWEHIEHPTKHAVINGCWQLQTLHALKNSMYKFIPDIGSTLIQVDSDEKRAKRDPISIRKLLYELPPVKATKLKLKEGR